MNNSTVDVKNMAPLDVHVTKDVVVVRQLCLWTALYKTYTFVPSKHVGHVYLSKKTESGKDTVTLGYTLYRPSAIEFSWHTDRTIAFHEVSKNDALKAQAAARYAPWKFIGTPYLGPLT